MSTETQVITPSAQTDNLESASEPATAAEDVTKDVTNNVKVPARKRKTPEPGDDFNEVEDVMLARRSVRAYRNKQVPEHLIHRLLEAGRFAPCAGNNQSWKFVVIRDADTIDGMTEHVQKWARRLAGFFDPTVPGALVGKRLANFNGKLFSRLAPGPMHPTGLAGLAEVAKGNLGVWHGAPTIILLLADTRGPGKPFLDVGIAGQNMCLAAHSMGLGTCWVSFAMFLEQSREYKSSSASTTPTDSPLRSP